MKTKTTSSRAKRALPASTTTSARRPTKKCSRGWTRPASSRSTSATRCASPIWRTPSPSSSNAPCRMCATASSRCTAASSTRCTTAATARTAATTSAPASSATSWASTIRTATPPSTTPSCAWPSHGACATRSSMARATSALRATIRRPPCVTPSAAWPRSPWRWCATSTRTPSTSRPITMARKKSRPCCRPVSRTCWSTVPPASPWAWPPTSRRTTCAKSPTACTGRSTIRTPAMRSCSTRLSRSSRGRTSRPPRPSWVTRASSRRTAPVAASSPCAPWSTPRRSTAACAW